MSRPKKTTSRSGLMHLPKTPVERRLSETALRSLLLEKGAEELEQAVLYQHSVFCQTSLPYRDPGNEVRSWERRNGNVSILVEAGKAFSPDTKKWVEVALPFGPKARLMLMHLNQRAIFSQNPIIEVGDSLTEFTSRVLRLGGRGREIHTVKEQLSRLAAADFRLGAAFDGQAITFKTTVVREFNLWATKNDGSQRLLWPRRIELSPGYFADLINHAVPLDEDHIAALQHSALALDIYTWLAQRLHRIEPGKPQGISWPALHAQFGQGYDPARMDKFRQTFRVALAQVLKVYRAAKVEEVESGGARPVGEGLWRSERAKGLKLHQSPPPVKRLYIEGS